MRVVKVSAKPAEARRPIATVFRSREIAGMAVVSCLLAAALWQVYGSRAAALGEASRRLAARETLLLTRGATAQEVAPYLAPYDDPKQRRFIAAQIARAVRDAAPDNTGALAAIHITRSDAERAGVLEQYRDRLDRARGGSVRLFTADEFARLKPSFAVRTPDEFRHAFRRWVALFFAVFWAAHLIFMLIGFRGDEYLLPASFLLAGTGMVLMVSLRDPVRDLPVFVEFARGALAGCALMIATVVLAHFAGLRARGMLKRAGAAGPLLDRANAASHFISRRGDLAFVAAVVLSVLLLVFGSGPGESGARVRLGPFQPVEIIRLLLVVFLAAYFARRWEFLRELKEKRIRAPINLPRADYALPVMIAVALSIGFFFLQKDLGPALLLGGLFLALYAVVRARAGLAVAALALLCAAVWLAYMIGYPPVAVTRVGMWLAPWNNGLARGEQVVHGLWAMATGQALGTGIGQGQPEIIPAAHTDFILAVLAEEAGFAGLLLIAAVYVLVFRRSIRIALRAATDYEFFLALGLTLAMALECALIAGGITGLLPLSGVVTPFLSYGGTAMLVNFASIGILLAISAKPARPAPHPQFAKPVAVLTLLFACFGGAVLARAAWVQVVKADDVVARGTLVLREDGSYAIAYNPRLVAIARQIPRGAIYDRTGLPLATSNWQELQKHSAEYAALGIDLERACNRSDARHYPFGPAMFQLLGDLRTRARWAASNASFEEKVSRTRLQGFDDRETLETVKLSRTGKLVRVFRYDYSGLVPLLRAHMDSSSEAVRKVLEAPHDVRLTVDARMQLRLTREFQEYLRAHGWQRGAVVVTDPVHGDLLAAVSVPLPPADPAEAELEDPPAREAIDLARFGQYPPGSAFKLVTAIAALRRDPALSAKKYECVRLPDGRIGNRVRGRIIRDDILDPQPHGSLDLRGGLVHSCNAFFSQLGTYDVGAQQLFATAQLFNIETAHPNTAKKLNEELPQAAYGQGQVLVTPYRMARVSAAIAAGGVLPQARFHLEPPDDTAGARRRLVLDRALAGQLASAMRAVVVSGTGRGAGKAVLPIAGKTGTAELANAPAHAWFTGFAPYAAPRVAFAIVVENAGYGGTAAAPFAALVAAAARALRPPEEEKQ